MFYLKNFQLVKTLNESIEKQKTILLNNHSFDEHSVDSNAKSNKSPFSFQKTKPTQVAAAPKSLPAPPHSLKLNNVRFNQTNFLKNQHQQQAEFHSNYSNKAKYSMAKDPTHSSPLQQNTFSKATLDNRPKQLIITGVENIQEKEAILNFVNAIGCQVENASEAQQNETTLLYSFIISFFTRKDAEIVSFIINTN